MTTPGRPATFLELEARIAVDPADLMSTLRDYATEGAAISADTVASIVARTPLDLDQMTHLAESAELGAYSQRSRGFLKDARAYERVAELIRGMAPSAGLT